MNRPALGPLGDRRIGTPKFLALQSDLVAVAARYPLQWPHGSDPFNGKIVARLKKGHAFAPPANLLLRLGAKLWGGDTAIGDDEPNEETSHHRRSRATMRCRLRA